MTRRCRVNLRQLLEHFSRRAHRSAEFLFYSNTSLHDAVRIKSNTQRKPHETCTIAHDTSSASEFMSRLALVAAAAMVSHLSNLCRFFFHTANFRIRIQLQHSDFVSE
jgi:hypothetical protein